ncbi:MAG: aldo/keto reductase [Dehalococcoidales bacterium]|nr:aldo/keto reductase [Dehalococcoidales bacterium]
MQYRKFGKLDWKVSALGFGAMRLPILNNNMAEIDVPEAIRMIRYAIDHGVNYVDTAYGYHNGNSEVAVGKALADGYRKKVRLATKLPSWLVDSRESCDKFLNTQLKRLQTDKIDFYLLHGLNKKFWENLCKYDVVKWAERAIVDGRIGHLGFSFHDDFPVFKKIVDSYDNWTFCQIQYNYVDENFQAGTRGLKYAHEKGLAVIVMEPVKGGYLARPPQQIAKLWAKAAHQHTPAEWALRWVWNHPEVSLVLSGMSEFRQVEENVAIADKALPNSLTADELSLLGQVKDAYKSLIPIPCTECQYCQPCPNGVTIPRIFSLYNEAIAYNSPDLSRRRYNLFISEKERADNCTKCGECEEKCPQKIAIPEWLEKAHELLKAKG